MLCTEISTMNELVQSSLPFRGFRRTAPFILCTCRRITQ